MSTAAKVTWGVTIVTWRPGPVYSWRLDGSEWCRHKTGFLLSPWNYWFPWWPFSLTGRFLFFGFNIFLTLAQGFFAEHWVIGRL